MPDQLVAGSVPPPGDDPGLARVTGAFFPLFRESGPVGGVLTLRPNKALPNKMAPILNQTEDWQVFCFNQVV